jgi:hypothetical protein
MNIQEASFKYVADLLDENCGVKVLITDDQTLTILGLTVTRTELLCREVVDTELLRDLFGQPVTEIRSSLKSVCILSPTRENVDQLGQELSTSPHYSGYSIYFTNSILESQVRQLARCDKYGLVERVEELYLDFFPVHSRLFSLNCPSILEVRMGQSDVLISRLADGIAAVLSALQLYPVIRYSGTSSASQSVGRAVFERVSRTPSSGNDGSLLLVVDRMSDPFTALLRPWFYIGAIHDLFGIRNNLVSIPGSREPFVINERQDHFLKEYGCSFLSEVGPAIGRQMSEVRSLKETAEQRIDHPDQIADIVRAAGRFQQSFTTASHHTAIVSSINEIVQRGHLIDIGELEQNIVTVDDGPRQCERLLEHREYGSEDCLRLLLLFQLRYEGRYEEHIQRLRSAFPEHCGHMIAAVASCGLRKRCSEESFSNRSCFTQLMSDIQSLREGGRALDQHRCHLTGIIERVKRGTLDATQYPFVGRRVEGHRVRRLIVFYVGGVTYSEMRAAVEATDIEVVVGGTTIHNAMSFIRSEIEPFSTLPPL